MNKTTEQARRVFQQDRYATDLTGIEISFVGEHESRCTLTVDDRHRNARGAVMGGALFTLADFAAAVAANSEDIHEDAPLHWVSLDATIHYLSPCLGDRLEAVCVPLKTGRTTALYQTIIESPDNGKRYAIVETTMIFV